MISGGGSTEVIYSLGDDIKFSKSFNAGVVSFTEKYFKYNPPSIAEIETLINEVKNTFSEIRDLEKFSGDIISVAGTPTSLSCIKQNLSDYIEEKVEGSTLTISDLDEMIKYFSSFESEELLKKYPKILAGREDVILAGTIILKVLLELLDSNKTVVSGRGIRYGIIIDYVNNL